MPNIVLSHPIHGTKIAISDLEIQHDKRNGWKEAQTVIPEPVTVDSLEVIEPPSFLSSNVENALIEETVIDEPAKRKYNKKTN